MSFPVTTAGERRVKGRRQAGVGISLSQFQDNRCFGINPAHIRGKLVQAERGDAAERRIRVRTRHRTRLNGDA